MFTDDYSFVQREEGGYVNDPSDSGGATMAGVTQNTYDLYRKSKNYETRPVRYCTRLEQSDIYEGIWKDCKASELPKGLSMMHFDFAVNAGNNQAAKVLQRSVNVADDGIIGPVTMKAVQGSNIEETILRYAAERRKFYNALVAKRPKDAKFLNGWLARTDRCERRSLIAHRKADTN